MPQHAGLIQALTKRAGQERATQIADRTSVWVWPAPEEAAVARLSERLALPRIACVPHVLALRSDVGEAADRNAAVLEPDRRGITVTDVSVTVDRITGMIDRESLTEAVSRGVCEAVNLVSAVVDEAFYQGVDVTPAHVAAGLTVNRPQVLSAIDVALREHRMALVAGPSGAGKSAVLWMSAYDNRRCRWYRVRRLESRGDVDLLVRLARALMPTDRAPVGFVVDNVGLPGVDAGLWDALVEELALVPGTVLLGASRQEDLFLIRTLPRVRLIHLELDIALAAEIFGKLRSRGQTSRAHWSESFEQSHGLLLEYVHLLTHGNRLSDVLAEQIRARRRERRALEIDLLAMAGTASTWGADVALDPLVRTLGVSDPEASAALQRLIGEHLLQQREDGSIGGLHRLRSRAIFEAIHSTPPPTVIRSIGRVLPVLVSSHSQAFLIGVLVERNDLAPAVINAAAGHVLSTGVEAAVETLLALRAVDFRTVARRWLRICEEEGVPSALRPLVAQCALMKVDLSTMAMFKSQVRAANQRILQEPEDDAALRLRFLAKLPQRWVSDRLLSLRSCRDVVRLLRALSGLAQGEPELRTLSGIDGSALAATLSTAAIEDLADIVAAGRAISTETARTLLNASGGAERALMMLEANTPWCRNLKVGPPTPELLDGREVTGLRPDSLVARVEYRYVSDTVQPDIHDATVALATTISRLHPDVDLVRAVALDARNRPYGYRGVEVASKWVERKSLPGEEQVAWNITRSQLVISMLTAESRTDEIAAEMKLLEQSLACLTTFAEAWLKDGEPGRLSLQAVNTQRSSLIRAIDEIVTSDDSRGSSGDVQFASLTPILRDCVDNVIARLSNDTENFRAVAAFINTMVHVRLPKVASGSHWRYLGYTEPPPQLANLGSTLRDLGSVAAEIGFGGTAKTTVKDAVRTVRRPLALRTAARTSRSWADARFDRACRQLQGQLSDSRWTLTLMKRESTKPEASWPPVDLLLLVHVDRLDQFVEIIDRLVPARSVLPIATRLSVLPVRESTVVPLFGVTVHYNSLCSAPDAAEEWPLEGYTTLRSELCSSFVTSVKAAVALSSLAALPGGPREGIEASAVPKLVEELTRSQRAFGKLQEAQPESLLLAEARVFVSRLVVQVVDELLPQSPSAGQLARSALDADDGVQSELASAIRGHLLLLTEWAISPERATQMLEDNSDRPSGAPKG